MTENRGRVFIKIYSRDLEGKDCDILELEIENGKIKVMTKGFEPKKEEIKKMG